jgi:lipoprotein-releasing system permease protein
MSYLFDTEWKLALTTILLLIAIVWLLRKTLKWLPAPTFEWFIAKTYFHSTKNKGFISLISVISIIGLILGTASVIVAASFMNGMQEEVMSRVIATDSHIKIRGYLNKLIKNDSSLVEKLNSLDHVIGVSPKVMNYALISEGPKKRPYPVVINGIDLTSSQKISDLKGKMIDGNFDVREQAYVNTRNGKTYHFPGIILAKNLAYNLGLVGADVGQLLRIGTVDELDFDLAGSTKINRVILTGIVELGFPEFDQTFAYTSLDAAQKLFNFGDDISYYDIKLDNEKYVNEYVQKIDDIIEYPMTTQSWKEDWAVHFNIMEWEKKVYMICLGLIICLASFNILSTLYMLVKDKTKDIGVLRSLGVTRRSIVKIFLNQGMIIGLIGSIGGTSLALVILKIQDTFKSIRFPENTLIIDFLPVLINPYEVAFVFCFTFFIASVSSLYPALIASRLKPVDAFRYE